MLQLCLAAAVRAAAQGRWVAYLDTSNAVTGRRLAQLHAALPWVRCATPATRTSIPWRRGLIARSTGAPQ